MKKNLYRVKLSHGEGKQEYIRSTAKFCLQPISSECASATSRDYCALERLEQMLIENHDIAEVSWFMTIIPRLHRRDKKLATS